MANLYEKLYFNFAFGKQTNNILTMLYIQSIIIPTVCGYNHLVKRTPFCLLCLIEFEEFIQQI